MGTELLSPRYAASHAVVVGIDQYKHASPLHCAVNDATVVAETLTSLFGFSAENVHLLTDSMATRSAILRRFLSFAESGTDFNDRLIVFFAGHGHTVRSTKGEVGFLVPYEGDPDDLSSLIR